MISAFFVHFIFFSCHFVRCARAVAVRKVLNYHSTVACIVMRLDLRHDLENQLNNWLVYRAFVLASVKYPAVYYSDCLAREP